MGKGIVTKPGVSGVGKIEDSTICKRCGIRPKVNMDHMKLEICEACFTSNA